LTSSEDASPPAVAAQEPEGLRRETLWLLAASAAIAVMLALAGRLSPWISPDTPGYFDLGPWPDLLARPRNPLYGWLVGWLPGGLAAVPALQLGLYFLAVVLLHRALRRYGVSGRAAGSVSAGVLISNVVLLWSNAILPECLAVACALVALAALLLRAAGHRPVANTCLLGLSLGASYVLRPTFLPAAILFPLLYLPLCRLKGRRATAPAFLGVAFACVLPFLAVASLRLATVRDFNIVSFGGFQMSGMAGLMLDEDVVRRLPADIQPLARQILDRRTQAEARGTVLPTPTNSTGQRSFVSAAAGYYDIYARTYDALLYEEINALRGDEDWVAWNQRLMRFAIATIRAAPARYAAWVVGGTSRAVGRLLVTNLAFMLGCIALAAAFVAACWRPPRRDAPDDIRDALDMPVLLLLAVSYTVAAGALMVLVTFPAGRYLDSAGILLPALPIYLTLRLLRPGPAGSAAS